MYNIQELLENSLVYKRLGRHLPDSEEPITDHLCKGDLVLVYSPESKASHTGSLRQNLTGFWIGCVEASGRYDANIIPVDFLNAKVGSEIQSWFDAGYELPYISSYGNKVHVFQRRGKPIGVSTTESRIRFKNQTNTVSVKSDQPNISSGIYQPGCGSITITTGQGGTTSGNGGSVTITAGCGTTTFYTSTNFSYETISIGNGASVTENSTISLGNYLSSSTHYDTAFGTQSYYVPSYAFV